MGPQTVVSGSALSMRSNLVLGRFAQKGPQDRKKKLFGVFGPKMVLRKNGPATLWEKEKAHIQANLLQVTDVGPC